MPINIQENRIKDYYLNNIVINNISNITLSISLSSYLFFLAFNFSTTTCFKIYILIAPAKLKAYKKTCENY